MKVKPVARKVNVRVAGVRVRLSLDEDDRPVSANVLDDLGARGSDRDKVVTLAAALAFEAAHSGAQTKKSSRDGATAAKASAEERASEKHWSYKWFALAYAKHPDCGRATLVRYARQLAALDEIAPVKDQKKRNEISPDRARRFLERKRNAGE